MSKTKLICSVSLPWTKSMLTLLASLISITLLAQYPAGSPVAVNGKLKLVGNKLSNECGNPVQLRGMSTHGIQWFQKCYTPAALDALADSWKSDVLRLAMYVQEGGYVNNPSGWKAWIDNMVNECGKRGIYCLIDWHVLNPGDPNVNIVQAREFWSYMSAKHAGKKHVLYEICNEPNGVDWQRVKTYADDIIPRIRANDPSTVIIVGTPNWSQDVDIAANNKLSYSNIMYTLHFYSGTHTDWLRNKANTALSKGLALFVTEFGTSLATGDGGPFLAEGQKWIDWMAANSISWANWSFADKAEISAALTPGSCGGNWNSTTASGTWIKQKLTSPADNFNCSSTGNTGNQLPKAVLTSPNSGAVFTAPATILVNASASDADGTVSKVEFYNGTSKIGEDVSSPYLLTWSVVPAGTYSVWAKATDNKGGVANSDIVTISVGSTTVTSCQTVVIPDAAQWVVRNAWADQSNGSKVGTTAEGMKVTHRQYGMNNLWVLNSGKTVALQAGKKYQISFDFSNDALNPVTGIEVGFSGNTNWDGPTLLQPAVNVAAGFPVSYSTKTVAITAAAAGNATLALRLKWASQPNQSFNGSLRNVAVCPVSNLRTETVSYDVSNNPFETTAEVKVNSEEEGPLHLSIVDFAGRVMYESDAHSLNEYITIGERLTSGIYFVKGSYANHTVVFRIVKR